MKTAYCLTGLGADERIFQRISIEGLALKHINWVQPVPGESLQVYAARIARQIPDPRPALIGVSFGGMMAIEIAKLMPTEKVILISSVKSTRELPAWMRACGKMQLDQLLPKRSMRDLKSLKALRPIENFFLGASGAEEKKLANEFRDNVDPVYLKWAIHQVINWKNEWQPDNIYHIHGAADHIFPIQRIRATHVIAGGGHFMVMNRNKEVSGALETILHISAAG